MEKDIWSLNQNKANSLIIKLLVFLIPSQVAFHIWPAWAFVYGIRVDYLSPALYLTDILVAILVGINFPRIGKKLVSHVPLVVVVVALVGINTYTSVIPWLTFYRWVKLALFAGFASVALDYPVPKKTFALSAIAVTCLGITQMILGKTTGVFAFLGERSFTLNTPGIALASLFGRVVLRPYATFPHPNVFAGYLVVVFWLILALEKKSRLRWLALIACLGGIALSFSLGAWLAFGAASLAFLAKDRFPLKTAILAAFVVSLVVPLVNLPGERGELARLAGEIGARAPLTGVGLGGFIPLSPFVSQGVWMLQPVHNLQLLVFSETGSVGLVGFWLLLATAATALQQTKGRYYLIAALVGIVVTGLFDHYWLTLQASELMLVYILGLAYGKTNNI